MLQCSNRCLRRDPAAEKALTVCPAKRTVAALKECAMTPFQPHDPYDWAALLAMIKRAFSGMEGRIDPPSSLHKLTADKLAHFDGEVWVIGRPPQACMLLTPMPHALYLGKLSVDKPHHRKGLAHTLIAHAETRARDMGLPALELRSRIELVENHAIFFAMGFQQTGATAHPGYDRPTSLTFTKTL